MKKMTILDQSRDNCKEARGKLFCLSASFVAETKECFHKQEEFIYLIKSVAKPFTWASAVILDAKNRLGLLVEKIFHDFWTILNIHFLIIQSQYTDQSVQGNYENILH